jgi:hypothetical protein
MTWRRQINYLGSRTYGPAVATETISGRLRHTAELYVDRAKQRFKAMLRLGIARATTSNSLDHRGFSLLGSKRANKARDDCAFPKGPARERSAVAPKAP